MKQIKTILKDIPYTEGFDKEANALLADGWTLTNRQIIRVKSEPNDVGSCAVCSMLYAEFEKDVPAPFEEITE